MSKLGCALFAGVLALTACGGGGASAIPAPTSTPGPVTFVRSGGSIANPPTLAYTISFDGSVVRTVNGANALTASLTATQTAALYADLKSAWPLTALTPAGVPDFPSLTISWQGQTSPDIFGGTNTIEAALQNDFTNAYQLFPSPSP